MHESSLRIRSVGAIRLRAEGVERRQRALGRHLEEGAAGRAIQISVRALHQSSGGSLAVGAARLGAEAVQRGECSAWSDSVNFAETVPAPLVSGSVEIAVSRLDQNSIWVLAIAAVQVLTEAIERGQRTRGVDLEDRARIVDAAVDCRAIEISVGPLDQRSEPRICAVGAIKAGQTGKGLCR